MIAAIDLPCWGSQGDCHPSESYMVKPRSWWRQVIFRQREKSWTIPAFDLAGPSTWSTGLLSYTHHYQMSYIGNVTVTRLRDELFASIQRQPLSFFDGEAEPGCSWSRLTYDVNLLQDAVTRVVTSFFKDTFTVIGLTAVIFYQQWRLALMAMVVFPLAVLIIVHLGKRVRRISHATQVANAYLYTVLQESLIGQRIVKAFARETYEEQRFFRANWDYFNIRMKLNATRELSPPVMEFLGSLGMAGIILYGGYAVIRGASTPGTFFSFLAALLMLYQPIKSLSSVQNVFQEGLAAAVRVFGLMDREPEIARRPRGRDPDSPGPRDRLRRGQLRLRRPGKRPARHRLHRAPGRSSGVGGPLRGRQIHPA